MDTTGQLNEFGKLTVRACAAYPQARIFNYSFIRYIDLIAMAAVAFRHVFHFIRTGQQGNRASALPGKPQPRRAPSRNPQLEFALLFHHWPMGFFALGVKL